MTHRVVDVESGEVLAGVVRWSKWTTAAWLPDGSGFYYGALTPPTPGREHLAPNEAVRLKLHLLGRPQPTDEVVYADPDPKREPEASTLDRGRWLVVATRAGTDPRSVVMVADQHAAPRQLKVLIPQPDFDSSVIGNDGETFYVLTDDGAPNKRLVAIDLGDPARGSWHEVIPEGKDALLEVAQVGSRLVAHSLHDASSRLQVWSASGEHLRDITVPPFATVTGLSGGQGPLLHFGISSFTDPASVWMCDVETGEVRRIRDAGLPIAADEVAVSRASTTSVDGTEVPMFLIHRRDTRPSGDVRTMLYGYGGFDIPITPDFKPAWLAWVERGGLLAVANLRGGGEFGKGWYEAGRRENKQNVFDDFAACARWLVEVGWTRPSRLVVNGASNGGLLVGALLTQHPELTGAAVPEVGVLDMLRYHRFTIGWAWMDDYGDPDDSEEYRWVRAYSPLHAIRPGTAYPPTLVMTGDHDDRVVPGHSFKFAAALQAAQGGPAPVLIRVETAAGHGANTPVSKLIDARADMLAFCEAAVD
jgi:prolyl oligopeptidase